MLDTTDSLMTAFAAGIFFISCLILWFNHEMKPNQDEHS